MELLANIELPEDARAAREGRRRRRGPVPQRIPVHGPRAATCPDEEEQYQAYRRAVEGMEGLPVTIRTIDVGADKPLDDTEPDERRT